MARHAGAISVCEGVFLVPIHATGFGRGHVFFRICEELLSPMQFGCRRLYTLGMHRDGSVSCLRLVICLNCIESMVLGLPFLHGKAGSGHF